MFARKASLSRVEEVAGLEAEERRCPKEMRQVGVRRARIFAWFWRGVDGEAGSGGPNSVAWAKATAVLRRVR